MNRLIMNDPAYDSALAIIGMSGRFPGANTIEDFWSNIINGTESIQFFTDEELLAAGDNPTVLGDTGYVKAGAILQNIDRFDATFFGFTPREAECTDPQHRFFLECSWEALEQAGYIPDRYEGLIGVFAGSAFPTYLLNNLAADPEFLEIAGKIQVAVGNDRDSLASKVSYKLNLRGPAIGVQTFCSTSLVATHLACQSLLTYECDIALAGGVAIAVPQVRGYSYEEGGILSPDGVCRTFDTDADGSVMGNGVGVVALKRLKEAIEAGDHIHAIVRGSAVNNDGSVRVGYTAPGVEGQSEVIANAISNADIPFDSIGYIEAHGTATKLGDAIELAALMKAFAPETQQEQFCALGSVKPNIGHLDRASGVTGLIKTSLMLQHQQFPPQLHFTTTNQDTNLDHSPFYVNTQQRPWITDDANPRRAGVNSFGLGGTNAHVVLEEAPTRQGASTAHPWVVLPLSARSTHALRQSAYNLANHLQKHPELPLAEVAYTLQIGRTPFKYRHTVICATPTEATTTLLAIAQQPESYSFSEAVTQPPVVFILSDIPESWMPITKDLYDNVEAFRTAIDECRSLLKEHCSYDVQTVFHRDSIDDGQESSLASLESPYTAFAVVYGLAQLFISWGINPQALLGQGVGAYVAVALAGVLDLEDVIILLREVVRSDLHNHPEQRTSCAHYLQTLRFQRTQIPLLSVDTGEEIEVEHIQKLEYWINVFNQNQHMQNIITRLGQNEKLCLNLGQTDMATGASPLCISALSVEGATHWGGVAHTLAALGALWMCGVEIDWQAFYQQERRLRVPLPTYPFERQRYWVDPGRPQHGQQVDVPPQGKLANVADWFYKPAWQQIDLSTTNMTTSMARSYLVFIDQHGVGEQVAAKLEYAGALVLRVVSGSQFAQISARTFSLLQSSCDDYQSLLYYLSEQGQLPEHVIHCWGITELTKDAQSPKFFKHMQECSFYSLLYFVKAFEQQKMGGSTYLTVISNGVQSVTNTETLCPEKATLLGVCKVVSQENPDIITRSIDLETHQLDEITTHQLIADILTINTERVIAYRQQKRWQEIFIPQRVDLPTVSPLRTKGVYLITGGLGGVGLILAMYLARHFQAHLALVSRLGLPDRASWNSWLTTHDPQDRTSQRIRCVQELEEAGAKVLILEADVANVQQMSAVVHQVQTNFGALHGVIHAAGISDRAAFGTAQEITVQACEWHFQPKVHGLYALETALQDHQLDFCLLFSSLSTVLGGLGLVAYAAANRFMDAFTYAHNRRTSQPWCCVDWDSWHVKDEAHGVLGATIAEYTMTPTEGIDAFNCCLASNESHLINSTGDLQTRIQQWVVLESLAEPAGTDTNHTEALPETTPTMLLRPGDDCERMIGAIWQQVLGVEPIGLYDNFFDLGGNSLIALQVVSKIRKTLQVHIPVVALFEAPTIRAMVDYLRPHLDTLVTQPPVPVSAIPTKKVDKNHTPNQQTFPEIAIVGMSGRFPGAATIDAFWHNLRHGVESLTYFTDEELLQSGVDPDVVKDTAYVNARPVLDVEHVETFDAPFFGFSPREAELTDPQQRLFLECCWEALEHAGYDAQRYPGLIGLFGGSNISTYMLSLMKSGQALAGVNDYQLVAGNDKDALTTSTSYKLNLRGPSLAVQTFCSTSLVAVHLACQSLTNGECDIALAGGVSVRVPHRIGHLYQEGGMESPDGHCRTFDAQARGSTFGDGAGIVVLKRLTDALQDGDTIHAVIKGSAINNDGSLKVSYTAPSVNGQADVVMRALEFANVPAESISYIEAHGTATELGDPIEIASLTKAFRSQTKRHTFCAIGSVKTNIGHLDRAAGSSGLIKTVLALKHRELPPSLHFESPNPEIDFENSPFFVNTQLHPWPRTATPRRAGVNSLGMGGTNAHVVVEEPPVLLPSGPSRSYQLLFLSARTPTALDTMTARLQQHLQEHPEIPLADVAYTLQVGRKQMEMRRVLLCRDRQDALQQLVSVAQTGQLTQAEKRIDRPVAWMFPGVGEQYVGMAYDLYRYEPLFRETVDHCCNVLEPLLQTNLSTILYPETLVNTKGSQNGTHPDLRALLGRAEPDDEHRLTNPVLAQCSTFVIEYALAQLLFSWGIRPQAMIGYSLGEYVAATLAGVLSLEDTLTLVAERARLIMSMPEGALLAVPCSMEELTPYLQEYEIDLAIHSGAQTCVLAGNQDTITQVEQVLTTNTIVCRRIASTHAFHSRMLTPLKEQVTQLVEKMRLSPPQIPYVSNVTGDWITETLACDPCYWAEHMCSTVRFADGIERVLREEEWVVLEVGPGQSLSTQIKQQPSCTGKRQNLIMSLLPSVYDSKGALPTCLLTLGKLWLNGVNIDWEGFYLQERRIRVPLPTYPFERQRYWLDIPKETQQAIAQHTDPLLASEPAKIVDLSDWFFLPSWKQTAPHVPFLSTKSTEPSGTWIIFMDAGSLGSYIQSHLLQHQQTVVEIYPGSSYRRNGDRTFYVRPGERSDYEQVFQALQAQGDLPSHIVHLWMVTEPDDNIDTLYDCGFLSLLALGQVLGDTINTPTRLSVISSELYDVNGTEKIVPEKALLQGPCKVIPQEYPQIFCRHIDVALPQTESKYSHTLLAHLVGELTTPDADDDRVVALRGYHRWSQTFEPCSIDTPAPVQVPFREEGVYVITGGMGGIGLALAEHFARVSRARLVLIGRSSLPERDTWDAVLQEHGHEVGVGQRIYRIQQIEALGSPTLLIQADVTQKQEMEASLSQTMATFGTVHGIIHAAGLPPSGLITGKTPEMAAAVLAPKVTGTQVIDRVVTDLGISLDFLLLFSSKSALTGGGPGQTDYCAANAYLDAFAQQQHQQHGVTVAVNWCEWQWDAWSAGLEGYPPEVRDFLIRQRETFGLTFTEGTEALTRILARGLPQAVVSTQPFQLVVDQSKQFSIATMMERIKDLRQSQPAYPRPLLSTPYVAPDSELEQDIITIWGDLLGIEQIGIHDNFFELGGHSLIGAQLIARLRQVFQITLSLESIFEFATVAELAAVVELALIDDIEQDLTMSVSES
ncbi:MAG: SDR family oxidoreductase [Chloroflexota bacterium]